MAIQKDTSTGAPTSKYTSSGLAVPGKKNTPIPANGVGYNPQNALTPAQVIQYEDLLSYTDITQRSMAVRGQLEALKNIPDPKGFYSNLFDSVQDRLRRGGFSKGTTAIGSGIMDDKDIKAFFTVLETGYRNNISYESVLEDAVARSFIPKEPKTTFSKTISKSINLLDAGDAKSTFSKAYFLEYNRFPPEKMINDFMTKWNARATKEAGKTISTGTSTSTGTGTTTGTSTNVTVGRGFTAEEQADFLAKYLQKNFPNIKNVENLGGSAKELYDTLAQSYSNNLMATPEFSTLIKQVKDLVGISDEAIRTKKIEDVNAKVRRQAKALYQGYSEQLDAGDDLMEYASNYANIASQEFGRTVKPNEDIVKQIMSFRDAKGMSRPATASEAIGMIRSTKEFDSSAGGKNYWMSAADAIRRGMGR